MAGMDGTGGTRPLRVGMVGTGHWARTVHLPALAAMAGIDLVGVHGRTPVTCETTAAAHGIAPFHSFDTLLDRVDAVVFAVPPDAQAGLALRAARAGRHLLLEKPIATTIADATALVSAIRSHGVAAVVFLTRMFVPDARDFLARATALAPDRAEASFRSANLLPGTPYTGSGWRQETFGALWDVGPHSLSMLLPAMGPVRTVEAWLTGPSRYRCRLGHASGGISTVEIDLKAHGVEGAEELYRVSRGDAAIEGGRFRSDRQGSFTAAIASLLDAIATPGMPVPGDIDLAFRIVLILDAAQRSIEAGGRPVDVTETPHE